MTIVTINRYYTIFDNYDASNPHISQISNIHKHIHRGKYIAELFESDDKDKFTVGPKYEWCCLDIIDKLSIKISDCNNFYWEIVKVHIGDKIPTIDLLKSLKITVLNLNDEMVEYICCCPVDVIDWFYNIYKKDINKHLSIIDVASSLGRTDILDWWVKSGNNIHYTENAIDKACCNNKIEPLKWWINIQQNCSKYPLKYTSYAADSASQNNNIQILQILSNIKVMNGSDIINLPFKYSEYCTTWASATNSVNALDWWYENRHNYIFKYSAAAVDAASKNQNIEALNWWLIKHKEKKLKMRYSRNCLNFHNCSCKTFDWWISTGLQIKYDCTTVENFARLGYVDLMNRLYIYAIGNSLSFSFTTNALDYATFFNRFELLDWWYYKHINSAINKEYDIESVQTKYKNHKWWINFNLLQ